MFRNSNTMAQFQNLNLMKTSKNNNSSLMKKEKLTIEQKDFSLNAIQEIKSSHRKELRLKTFRNSNKKSIERKDSENCKKDDKFLLDSFLLKSTLKCSERHKMNLEKRRTLPQLKLE